MPQFILIRNLGWVLSSGWNVVSSSLSLLLISLSAGELLVDPGKTTGGDPKRFEVVSSMSMVVKPSSFSSVVTSGMDSSVVLGATSSDPAGI